MQRLRGIQDGRLVVLIVMRGVKGLVHWRDIGSFQLATKELHPVDGGKPPVLLEAGGGEGSRDKQGESRTVCCWVTRCQVLSCMSWHIMPYHMISSCLDFLRSPFQAPNAASDVVAQQQLEQLAELFGEVARELELQGQPRLTVETGDWRLEIRQGLRTLPARIFW